MGPDWVGVMIERVSGLSLEDYFKKNIFTPLGMEDTTFFPTASMKSRLAHMHTKIASKVFPYDHIYRRPLVIRLDEQSSLQCSGGAGLFGKPTEYLSLWPTYFFLPLSPLIMVSSAISKKIP